MKRRFITPLLATLYLGVAFYAYPFQSPSSQQQQAQPKSQPKKNEAAMTGCVDQQEGNYLLVDVLNLTPIAKLEADGFPTEGFAKHMGHKVTIRGTASSGGALPLFKVRVIETISENCAPQPK